MVSIVKTEVLPDGDVVYATCAICRCGLSLANQTRGPRPFHMFNRTSRLGEHDGRIGSVGGRPIRDGEVAARIVTVHEDGDVVDETGAVWCRV